MSKREEIAPNGDKRYIRRDDEGQIKTSVEEGRSLSDDAQHTRRRPTRSLDKAIAATATVAHVDERRGADRPKRQVSASGRIR